VANTAYKIEIRYYEAGLRLQVQVRLYPCDFDRESIYGKELEKWNKRLLMLINWWIFAVYPSTRNFRVKNELPSSSDRSRTPVISGVESLLCVLLIVRTELH
jgi:hypothetical protein